MNIRPPFISNFTFAFFCMNIATLVDLMNIIVHVGGSGQGHCAESA